MIWRMQSLPPSGKMISELTALEARSAIRRRERSGDLSGPDSSTALRNLQLELARLKVHPLSSDLVAEATRLIDRSRLKALDALQLSSALRIQAAEGRPIIFVASDQFLLEAAAREGLLIWNPEAP